MSVVCLRCCLTSLPLHAEAHSGSKGPHPGHTVSTLKCQRDSKSPVLQGLLSPLSMYKQSSRDGDTYKELLGTCTQFS